MRCSGCVEMDVGKGCPKFYNTTRKEIDMKRTILLILLMAGVALGQMNESYFGTNLFSSSLIAFDVNKRYYDDMTMSAEWGEGLRIIIEGETFTNVFIITNAVIVPVRHLPQSTTKGGIENAKH